MKYTATYTWYGTTVTHEIEADNPKQAMYREWKKHFCGTFKDFVRYWARDITIEPSEAVEV